MYKCLIYCTTKRTLHITQNMLTKSSMPMVHIHVMINCQCSHLNQLQLQLHLLSSQLATYVYSYVCCIPIIHLYLPLVSIYACPASYATDLWICLPIIKAPHNYLQSAMATYSLLCLSSLFCLSTVQNTCILFPT